jgi:adenylate cyclase class 2
MPREIEVKVRVESAAAAARLLRDAGAEPVRARELEDNRVYDRDGGALAAAGRMLRLRRVGARAVLTAKALPAEAEAGFKVRREEETEIPDADAMERALEAAGFEPVWRYQKYRTTWRLDGTVVTLDELPGATWLEIEGDPARIDAAARRLGFRRSDYETRSYRELLAAECETAGVPVPDLVFPAGPEPGA